VRRPPYSGQPMELTVKGPNNRWPTQEWLALAMLVLLLLTALLFLLGILRGHTAARLLPFALISMVAFSGLVIAYIRTRAAWVRDSMVVLVTGFLVGSLDSGAFSTVLTFALLLPTICALLLSSTHMVMSIGVLTYLIILWRSDFQGIAADVGNAAFYGLLVTGLVLGRMGLTWVFHATQAANAQRTQLNTALESQVAARTVELRAALTQVEAVMQARSAMVLDVAHDLCNYMQNLRAHATFLEWSYADMQAGVTLAPGEDMPALFTALHAAIDRVITFSSGLQDAALLEQQRLPLHMAPYPLSDEITTLIAPLATVFAQQQIALVVAPPPHEVVMLADPTYLRRVVENVLSNALKFTAQQQTDGCEHTVGQVVITWGVLPCGTQAHMTISDNGIGIAPDDLVKLGERFTRVHAHPIAGSGVGLHFAMQVIAAMGGQLQITSPGLGCGTTVALFLPLAEPTSAPVFPPSVHAPIKEQPHEPERQTQRSSRPAALRSAADCARRCTAAACAAAYSAASTNG
jgi:signal transduction histidine kinase